MKRKTAPVFSLKTSEDEKHRHFISPRNKNRLCHESQFISNGLGLSRYFFLPNNVRKHVYGIDSLGDSIYQNNWNPMILSRKYDSKRKLSYSIPSDISFTREHHSFNLDKKESNQAKKHELKKRKRFSTLNFSSDKAAFRYYQSYCFASPLHLKSEGRKLKSNHYYRFPFWLSKKKSYSKTLFLFSSLSSFSFSRKSNLKYNAKKLINKAGESIFEARIRTYACKAASLPYTAFQHSEVHFTREHTKYYTSVPSRCSADISYKENKHNLQNAFLSQNKLLKFYKWKWLNSQIWLRKRQDSLKKTRFGPMLKKNQDFITNISNLKSLNINPVLDFDFTARSGEGTKDRKADRYLFGVRSNQKFEDQISIPSFHAMRFASSWESTKSRTQWDKFENRDLIYPYKQTNRSSNWGQEGPFLKSKKIPYKWTINSNKTKDSTLNNIVLKDKDNLLKITETDIIKRTALLKFLQILDGFHSVHGVHRQENKVSFFLRGLYSLFAMTDSFYHSFGSSPSLLSNFKTSQINRRPLKLWTIRDINRNKKKHYQERMVYFIYNKISPQNLYISRNIQIRENPLFISRNKQRFQHRCKTSADRTLFSRVYGRLSSDTSIGRKAASHARVEILEAYSKWGFLLDQLNTKRKCLSKARSMYYNQKNFTPVLQKKKKYHQKKKTPPWGGKTHLNFLKPLKWQTYIKHFDCQRSLKTSNPILEPTFQTSAILQLKNFNTYYYQFLANQLWKDYHYINTEIDDRKAKTRATKLLHGFSANKNYKSESRAFSALTLLCVGPSHIEDILGTSQPNDSGSYILPDYFQLLGHGQKFKKQGITIIASTNNLNTLDAALLRPGRFDTIINFSKAEKMEASNPFLQEGFFGQKKRTTVLPQANQENRTQERTRYLKQESFISSFSSDHTFKTDSIPNRSTFLETPKILSKKLENGSLHIANLKVPPEDNIGENNKALSLFSSKINTDHPPVAIKKFIDVSIFVQYKLWWASRNFQQSDEELQIWNETDPSNDINSFDKLKNPLWSEKSINKTITWNPISFNRLTLKLYFSFVNKLRSISLYVMTFLQAKKVFFFPLYSNFRIQERERNLLMTQEKNIPETVSKNPFFQSNFHFSQIPSLQEVSKFCEVYALCYRASLPYTAGRLTTPNYLRATLSENSRNERLYTRSSLSCIFSQTEKKVRQIDQDTSPLPISFLKNRETTFSDNEKISRIKIRNKHPLVSIHHSIRCLENHNSFLKSNRSLLFCTGRSSYKETLHGVKTNAQKNNQKNSTELCLDFESYPIASQILFILENKALSEDNAKFLGSLQEKYETIKTNENHREKSSQKKINFDSLASSKLTKYNDLYKSKKKSKQSSFFKLHSVTSIIIKRWAELKNSSKFRSYLHVSYVSFQILACEKQKMRANADRERPLPLLKKNTPPWGERPKTKVKTNRESLNPSYESLFFKLTKNCTLMLTYINIYPLLSYELFSDLPYYLFENSFQTSKIKANNPLTKTSTPINVFPVQEKQKDYANSSDVLGLKKKPKTLQHYLFNVRYTDLLDYKDKDYKDKDYKDKDYKDKDYKDKDYKDKDFNTLPPEAMFLSEKTWLFFGKTKVLPKIAAYRFISNQISFILEWNSITHCFFPKSHYVGMQLRKTENKERNKLRPTNNKIEVDDFQMFNSLDHNDTHYTNIRKRNNRKNDYLKTNVSFVQNYKMCRLDLTVFLFIFYNVYFSKKLSLVKFTPFGSDIYSPSFLFIGQFFQKNHSETGHHYNKTISRDSNSATYDKNQHQKITLNTFKISMPYKSLIFSHLLLFQTEVYGFSCKNFEILIYNKFKHFLMDPIDL